MSHFECWNKKNVKHKDMPTLQLVLRVCNEELLLRVIREKHLPCAYGKDSLGRIELAEIERQIQRALSSMKALALEEEKGDGAVIVPVESYVLRGDSGMIERRIDAKMIFINDLQSVFNETHNKKLSDFEDYSFVLDPWECTLAKKVWMHGLGCEREYYCMIASAFWEMVFFGLEYDKVIASQMREKSRCVLGKTEKTTSLNHEGIHSGGANLAASRQVKLDSFGRDYLKNTAQSVAKLNKRSKRKLQNSLKEFVKNMK